MQVRRVSAAAICSLALGLLGCVPFITSAAAIVLGIVGVRAARHPHISGRGVAISGLILGVAGIALWGIFGGSLFAFAIHSKSVSQTAQQFTNDLAAGNIAAAAQHVDAKITPARIQKLADDFKSWGKLDDLTLSERSMQRTGGKQQWTLNGEANFTPGGSRTVRFILVEQPDKSFKISGASFN